MQASIFNVCVPLPARDEVFLMNTLTDAQFVVSSDVAALLARGDLDQANLDGDDDSGRARRCSTTTVFSCPTASTIGARSIRT